MAHFLLQLVAVANGNHERGESTQTLQNRRYYHHFSARMTCIPSKKITLHPKKSHRPGSSDFLIPLQIIHLLFLFLTLLLLVLVPLVTIDIKPSGL